MGIFATYPSLTLNVLNWTAVFLHFTSFVSIVTFAAMNGDVTYKLTHNVIQFLPPLVGNAQDNGYVKLHDSYGGNSLYVGVQHTNMQLSLATMIAAFFLLSALFQAFFASPEMRYIEYTFSGSLVGTVIAIQVGLYDVNILLLIFTGLATCMLCGYLADILRTQMARGYFKYRQGDEMTPLASSSAFQAFAVVQGPLYSNPQAPMAQLVHAHNQSPNFGGGGGGAYSRGYPAPDMLSNNHITGNKTKEPEPTTALYITGYWFAHAIGWLPFMAWLVVVLASYITIASNNEPPWFVTWIIIIEAVLYTMFGITQLLDLSGVISKTFTKGAFIVQSLISKFFLGWILAAELFIPT